MSRPLFSLVTPTHGGGRLAEAYHSLRYQPRDWEWVIWTDNPRELELPPDLSRDSRLRLVASDKEHGQPPIGYCKQQAFRQASGEYLVELDHDDMLMPGVLAKLQQAIEEHQRPEFLYTDCAAFIDGGEPQPLTYDARYGWETYDVRVFGRRLQVTRAFPLTARSLCEIYFAPDHVRVWRRDFYQRLGGHDAQLPILDDLDLLCRSYLERGRFVHLPTCGYLYRHHDRNSHKLRAGQLAELSPQLRRKYLPLLIEEWCRRESLPQQAWHLGATGQVTKDELAGEAGTVGCVEITGDLYRYTYPLISFHLEDAYRQLVPGGWLIIRCPSVTGYNHWGPGLASYWHPQTFRMFSERQQHQVLRHHTSCPCDFRFQTVEVHEQRHPRSGDVQVVAYLCAIKGQRQPGPVLI